MVITTRGNRRLEMMKCFSYGETSSKSIVKGNSIRDRIQQMKETDIDAQHYAKSLSWILLSSSDGTEIPIQI